MTASPTVLSVASTDVITLHTPEAQSSPVLQSTPGSQPPLPPDIPLNVKLVAMPMTSPSVIVCCHARSRGCSSG